MNTATVICNTSRATGSSQVGSRAHGASDSTGDEHQQRFADVLPVAQAAVEQASEAETPDEAPAPDDSTKEQTVAEPSDRDESAAPDEQDASVDPQAVAVVWPFAGIVQPPIQRQASSGSQEEQAVKAAAGQQAGASTASIWTHKPLEQTAASQGVAGAAPVALESSDAGSQAQGMTVNGGALPTQQPPQKAQAVSPTSLAEQPVTTRPVTTTVPDSSIAQGQEVPPPAATVDGHVAGAARQMVQEKGAAPTPQISGDPAKVDPLAVGAQGQQVPAVSDSEADGRASQGGAEQGATTLLDETAADPSAVVDEKTGQTPASTRQADSRQTAGSDRAAYSQTSALNSTSVAQGHADDTAEPLASVSSESSNGLPTQSEAQDAVVSHVKDPGTATAEFRVAPAGESVAASRPAVISTQSQASVDAPSVPTPVQSVADQILDSIRSSGSPGEREVSIRLQPPELGMVVVRFHERGEHLTGTLEVSTREAQREIEQALPQVLRGLQEAGVLVRRVEVVTSDQSQRNLGGEHLPQDTWQQHQGGNQGREHSPAASHTRWSQGLGEQGSARRAASGAESQTAGSPGRIDVLL